MIKITRKKAPPIDPTNIGTRIETWWLFEGGGDGVEESVGDGVEESVGAAGLFGFGTIDGDGDGVGDGDGDWG